MDVHAFAKGIGPKVNVIVQLEFKVACSRQHISQYATRTPLG